MDGSPAGGSSGQPQAAVIHAAAPQTAPGQRWATAVILNVLTAVAAADIENGGWMNNHRPFLGMAVATGKNSTAVGAVLRVLAAISLDWTRPRG